MISNYYYFVNRIKFYILSILLYISLHLHYFYLLKIWHKKQYYYTLTHISNNLFHFTKFYLYYSFLLLIYYILIFTWFFIHSQYFLILSFNSTSSPIPISLSFFSSLSHFSTWDSLNISLVDFLFLPFCSFFSLVIGLRTYKLMQKLYHQYIKPKTFCFW